MPNVKKNWIKKNGLVSLRGAFVMWYGGGIARGIYGYAAPFIAHLIVVRISFQKVLLL